MFKLRSSATFICFKPKNDNMEIPHNVLREIEHLCLVYDYLFDEQHMYEDDLVCCLWAEEISSKLKIRLIVDEIKVICKNIELDFYIYYYENSYLKHPISLEELETDHFSTEAFWSGAYPNLCSGKWSLLVNGVNVSEHIPEDLRKAPMNIRNTYTSWYFDDTYAEAYEEYEDGLDCWDWIEKNKGWLDKITTDDDVQIQIYEAFRAKDWRGNSCGGCI